MNVTDQATTPPLTYTPGLARLKALMILFGLILFLFGVWQLRTPFRLLAFGERTEAEATVVIKTKEGLPDLVLHDDAQIQANLETRDRSYFFWNEFSFHTADGRMVNVRATVGSQLKPLYPLLDTDGLPTTDLIYYDPKHPETVVFPDIISTWFAPGALIFIGFLATLIGSFLLYWANKPIELPHLPPQAPTGEPDDGNRPPHK
jgi:hypothetical protein